MPFSLDEHIIIAHLMPSVSDRWSYSSPVVAGFSEPGRPPNAYVLSDGRPINMQGKPNVQCALNEISCGHRLHTSPDGMSEGLPQQVP